MPYYNAVSERFVRDWTKGKIVFVVRDARDREHGALFVVDQRLCHELITFAHKIPFLA